MELIYDKSVLRPLPARLGWTCATGLLWALWISLWAPLLALADWPFGVGMAVGYLHLPLALTMIGMESMALFLLGSMSISSFFLLMWSGLSYLRFRNANRRARLRPTQLEELADYSALLTDKVAAWQKARRVVVHHDENGRLLEAEVVHCDPKTGEKGLVVTGLIGRKSEAHSVG